MEKIEIDNRDTKYHIDTYTYFTGDSVYEMIQEDYYNEKGEDAKDPEINFNMDQIREDLAKKSIDLMKEFIEDDKVIKKIELLKSGSPRFYNYTTDYYRIMVDYNEVELENYIKENADKYREYIKDIYFESDVEYYKITFYIDSHFIENDYIYPMHEVETETYYENVEIN